MDRLPRVKVVNSGEGWLGTEYYINNQKIECVKAIDFHVGVEEIPTFIFETMGLPDIDTSGDIRFSFTPETVEEAKKILEHEARKHRVDIKLHNSCCTPYIDGNRVPCCEIIDSDNEKDDDSMKFIPDEQALFSDYVQINLSSYTRFAMIVLRNELLKHGDLYDGFLASMRSAIDDKFWSSREVNGYECSIGQEDFDEVAELMLKRIIGEE